MSTPTVIIGKKGSQFYAALVGFPANKFYKTKAGAIKYADRLATEHNAKIVLAPELVPQALKVYYADRPYRHMPTKEAILCVEHRSQLFSSNPSAYGNGEFFPAEECEMCKKENAK